MSAQRWDEVKEDSTFVKVLVYFQHDGAEEEHAISEGVESMPKSRH